MADEGTAELGRWRARAGWAALALGAALAGWYIFAPQPVPVDLAIVAKGPLVVTVDDDGTTAIREVYTVSAPISGRVMRNPLKPGDPVREGQTLVASIEPVAPAFLDERSRRQAAAQVSAAEAALTQAQADIARMKAELGFAQSDLERAERLRRRDTISERSFEEARLKVETMTASLATARAQADVRARELEIARAQLIEPSGGTNSTPNASCCLNMLAPTSGRVLKNLIESEQVVAAGTPLMEIGNPADIEIVAELLSAEAVRVKEGARAIIERWGGDRALAAEVRRVEPAGFEEVSALGIREQRVRVRLDPVQYSDADKAAWAALGHGYRVFARIVVDERKDAVKLPLSALFRHGDGWATFRVEAGRAKGGRAAIRAVEIGARNQEEVEVLAGVSPGDAVILHPSDRIAEAVRVIDRAGL